MADAAASVVPAFEAKNPGVKVNIIPIPYTTYQQKVTTELAARSGAYDVIESHLLMQVPFVASRAVLPLDNYLRKAGINLEAEFVKSMVDMATLYGKGKQLNPQGSVYGLPYNSDVMLFLYRKDLYNKYGLGLPKTWGEASEQFKAIASKEGIAGFAFSGARKDNSHLVYDFYNIALNTGGTLPLGPGYRPQMKSPGNVEALRILRDIVASGAAPSGVEEYRYADKNTAFAQGMAAAMTQWMLSAYKSVDDPASSRVAGRVGYAPVPGGVASSGGWVVSIVSTTKHPDEAFEFIQFLTNHENNLKLALEFGNGPTRKSVFADPRFTRAYPFGGEMAIALERAVSYMSTAPDVAVWAELTDIINDRLADAVFGKLGPEDALAEADREMARILRQAGYLK